jgi:hypothetical protein
MGARPYPSEGSRMRASVRGVGRAAQGSGGRQKDPLVPARLGGRYATTILRTRLSVARACTPWFGHRRCSAFRHTSC